MRLTLKTINDELRGSDAMSTWKKATASITSGKVMQTTGWIGRLK